MAYDETGEIENLTPSIGGWLLETTVQAHLRSLVGLSSECYLVLGHLEVFERIGGFA